MISRTFWGGINMETNNILFWDRLDENIRWGFLTYNATILTFVKSGPPQEALICVKSVPTSNVLNCPHVFPNCNAVDFRHVCSNTMWPWFLSSLSNLQTSLISIKFVPTPKDIISVKSGSTLKRFRFSSWLSYLKCLRLPSCMFQLHATMISVKFVQPPNVIDFNELFPY